jgi:hypothetical protein
MKNKIVAIVLAVTLAMSAGSALAQKKVQLGVRAGIFSQDMEMKFGDVAGLGNTETDAKMGFNVAAVARVRLIGFGSGALGAGLFVQPEILYSQNTYKIAPAGGDVAKIKMQSVDIPLLLSVKLSIVRVQAGPVFNVMQKSPSNLADIDLMMRKPTVSYALGASVDIWGGLVLDGRFNGQFKELKNDLKAGNGAYESVKGSLSSWSLGIGWLF